MARTRKVIRTKNIYKKSRSKGGRVFRGLLYLFLILALVGFGFIFSREWSIRFGPDAPKPSSDLFPSSLPQEEPSSDPEESVSSQEEPPPAEPFGRVRKLSEEELRLTGEALEAKMGAIRAEGAEIVLFELKTEEGFLLYDTANEKAQVYGAIDSQPAALDPLVAAAREAGLKTAAQVSALKDPKAAHLRNRNSFAFGNQTNTNWMDNSKDQGGKPWLNPYMENTRAYLSELAAELHSRGMDIILLTNLNFPTKNTKDMNPINPFTSQEEILRQTLAEIQEAAGETRVLNCIDLAEQATLFEGDAAAFFQSLEGADYGALISLDSIRERRTKLLPKLRGGVETALDPLEIAGELLDGTGENAVLILRGSDTEALEELLDARGYDSYLVI